MADIVYNWKSEKNSVGISASAELVDFIILRTHENRKIASLSSGNYSRLIAELDVMRSDGSFILRLYLPTFMLVLLSWIPLWLSGMNGYTRVALALGLFLVSLAWNSFHLFSMLAIGYMRLIDCYLISSSLGIFAVLLYLVVSIFLRKHTDLRWAQVGEQKGDTSLLDKLARWILPGLHLLYFICHYFTIKSALSLQIAPY